MNRTRKILAASAMAGSLLAGGAIGSAVLNSTANAATTAAAATPTTTAANAGRPSAPPDPSKRGHRGTNGVEEKLLTGTAESQARAAAQAAVPGGTIQRVENDAEGSAYEAHMTKADGTQVTVKMDSSFKVTSIDTGMR